MKCPVCKNPDLLMTERQGIEIDYCPTCRGVWLDRGELDKLLNQMQDQMQDQAEPVRRGSQRERDARYDEDHEDRREHHARRDQAWGRRHDDPRRRKKSLFDMFDFD